MTRKRVRSLYEPFSKNHSVVYIVNAVIKFSTAKYENWDIFRDLRINIFLLKSRQGGGVWKCI